MNGLQEIKMIIASYVFGALGILTTIAVYQQKSRKGLLISKLICDAVWCLHYVFLSAYSAAAIAIIGVLREIVFVNRNKKWGKSRLWLPFFLVLSVVCTILTWKNYFSIFTCVASCLAVTGFFIGNPKLSRILSFPISACMITYDVAFGSYLGIANEILALGSSLIGLIVIDRKMKNEEPKQEEKQEITEN